VFAITDLEENSIEDEHINYRVAECEGSAQLR
jgi:hypothetical protein